MAEVETVQPASDTTRRWGWGRPVLNWALALLTVPTALVVVVVAIGGVMGTAGCTGQACDAPSPFWFGVLFYGAPVVAAVTILASFFTARRSWGIAVPLCALALLVVDLVVLVTSF